jgi:hypothetical protein
MEMSVGTKTALLVLVSVVVVAGIILYALLAHRGAAPTNLPQPKVISAASVPMPPTYFIPGTSLPHGFPAGLVQGSPTNISVATSSPQSRQYGKDIVQFQSASSPKTLYTMYETYFSQIGWNATSEDAGDPAILELYATKASSSAVVSLNPTGSSTAVTVTYWTQ